MYFSYVTSITIPLSENRAIYLHKNKHKLESELNVKINVDLSQRVAIVLLGENVPVDQALKIKSIIEAVNYGFDVDTALQLRDDSYVLDLIDLRDHVDKDKPNHLARVKGRIIGEKGKAKRLIEELTETRIAISDKTVAIIGEYENVRAAREAIEMLIRGRQHDTVYRWLRGWRREMKRRLELEDMGVR